MLRHARVKVTADAHVKRAVGFADENINAGDFHDVECTTTLAWTGPRRISAALRAAARG